MTFIDTEWEVARFASVEGSSAFGWVASFQAYQVNLVGILALEFLVEPLEVASA